jgi:cell division protein FtsN
MLGVERALIALSILLVAATAGVAGFIHVRAEAAAPDPVAATASSAPRIIADPPSRSSLSITAAEARRVPTPEAAPRARSTPAVTRRENAPPAPRRMEARSTPGVPAATPRPALRADVGLRPPETAVKTPEYVVHIGAIASPLRADDIASRLAGRGYRASVAARTSPETARYVVASELLRREIAEQRAKTMSAAGIAATLRARDNDLAQVVYGHFSTSEEADAAAQRIRRQGFTALVLVEGGTTYVVSVGPHTKGRIDEVVASLSGGRYAIEVEPAP